MKKHMQSILWLILLMTIWECVSRFGLVNPYLLPPFSKVVANTALRLQQGKLVFQILNSLTMVMYGFGISILFASIAVLLSIYLKSFNTLFRLLCTLFNPLPSVAVMPLIIMWFGINSESMIVLIVHAVVWSLIQHLLDGVSHIPQISKEFGRNLCLNGWQTFSGIYVYAVFPELLTGLRIGWNRAWRALISAEMVFGMIGNLGGVGYFIYRARYMGNLTDVMSGVVCLALIGIIAENLVFGQVEKHTIQKWGMTHE